MTTITREHLLKIQLWRETYGPGSNLVMPAEEAEELACMALAAMDSEPVAWTDDEELRDAKESGCGYLFGVGQDANKFAVPRRQIMLYRHAQPAPASEPVFFIEVEGDDWINAGRIEGRNRPDLGLLPDGINYLYAAPQPVPELTATVERLNASGYEYEGGEVTPQNVAAVVDILLQQLDDAVQGQNTQPEPEYEPVKRFNADQMHRICLEANRHLDKYGAMAKEVNKLPGRIPAQPAPVVMDERAAFNAWNNDVDCPLAGRDAKSAAWMAWNYRAMLKAGNPPVIPDTWIPVSERMPAPDSQLRVCAYTPTPHEDIRYRFVPASLFKAVCTDATHWHYMEPPAAPQEVKGE